MSAFPDQYEIGDLIMKTVEEQIKKLGIVNVLIVGKTGVGKSTLINAIFQGNIAAVGQGRPVTKEAREYRKEGIPVSIYDSRGLELAKYKETLSELHLLVREKATDQDPMRHIHVAWVCIAEGSSRIEDGEIEAVRMLSEYMPVLGVITKARSDNGFKSSVQSCLPQARNIIRVRAIKETDDDGNILLPKGLDDLVEATNGVIPEAQQKAFAAAQRVTISLKANKAHLVVAGAAASAAAAGAIPIPFSDAAVIVPIQVTMLAGISAVFGLSLSSAFIKTLVSSAASALGATMGGRAIVGGLLKLIPGAGTVLGGVISGTTAALLTTTVGEIYTAVLVRLFKDNAGNHQPSNEEIAVAFASALKKEKSKHGKSSDS